MPLSNYDTAREGIVARGRMISKAISLDENVNSLSDDTARLLFTWMIPHLDCEGRLHGDALTVKSIVFPRRNISPKRVEEYLNELEKNELIKRFVVNGNTYLFAPHFDKHQTGLNKNREAQSQLPPPPQDLIQSKSRISPLQVKDKVKDKVKEQVVSDDFQAYIKELQTNRYPGLNVAELWEDCQSWYADHNKPMKDWKRALNNWCKKELNIHPPRSKPLPTTKQLKEGWGQ